jgi:dTDP-4-dehydrorhamnose 3,5-epimerase
VGNGRIADIKVTTLQSIETPGGNVMHAMKKGDSGFADFGEAYFSLVEGAAVKGWKRHLKMTMNLVVPIGDVRFVFYQPEGTKWRIEEIGESRYVRLTVPPGVWFGFQGRVVSKSLVLNLANIEHEPGEVERVSLDTFQFEW